MKNSVEFFSNLMIPKSNDDNTLFSEKIRSISVVNLSPGKIVPATIELNGYFCLRAIEVENVASYGVLSAKLVIGEVSIS